MGVAEALKLFPWPWHAGSRVYPVPGPVIRGARLGAVGSRGRGVSAADGLGFSRLGFSDLTEFVFDFVFD